MNDPLRIARIMKDRIRGIGRSRRPRGIGEARRPCLELGESEKRRRDEDGVELMVE